MANSYLSRTVSSGGNQKTWTLSVWAKRGALDTAGNSMIFNYQDPGGNGRSEISFSGPDKLFVSWNPTGSSWFYAKTNPTRLFRDTSAWYHVVIACDTTQATNTNRLKIYINGEQVGSDTIDTYPAQDSDTGFNANTFVHEIGRYAHDGTSTYYSGYMSHFAWVDGQALAPTVFGETDATSGIWKFKSPSGVTWGTNGFHLKFENSGNLGLDSSGNSNTYTVGGNLIQSIDTPSNTYCTLNPNDVIKQSIGIAAPTFSNANLTMSSTNNANRQTFGTISPETGKWYWEMKIDVANTTGHRLGIFFSNNKTHGGSYYYGADAFYIHQNGEIYYNGSSTTYMSSYTAGDIISVALDITNGNIYMSKNGGASDSTWADGSGNNNQAFPGTSINGKLSASWPAAGTPITPFFDVYGTNNKQSINFGNGFFGTTAIASAGSNGNGSLFEYDVPSGFYALNTKNINTYG